MKQSLYIPPPRVVLEARKGLQMAAKRPQPAGFMAQGRALSTRQSQTEKALLAMLKYFAGHEVDRRMDGWMPGEAGYPSNGRVRWALLGGDPCRTWANSVLRKQVVPSLLSLQKPREGPPQRREDIMEDGFIRREVALESIELSGAQGRTLIARMLQWDAINHVTDNGRDWYDEVWRRGSFADTIKRAESLKRGWPLTVLHNERTMPVGVTTSVHEREDGPYFTGKISRTNAGDEVLELIRDGALPGVSVGCKPIRSTRTAKGTIERNEVAMREIALTPWPALVGADIMTLRSEVIDEAASFAARAELEAYLQTLQAPGP